MAKCLRQPVTGEVVRVSATEAAELAAQGWEYIGKSDYQRLRDKVLLAKAPKQGKVAHG